LALQNEMKKEDGRRKMEEKDVGCRLKAIGSRL
jgi:hypothetical protein